MALEYDGTTDLWRFETEELQGSLQPKGERHGVKQLLHKPSGAQVVHPRYDALNLFLLFSTNLCMGTARANERSVRQEGDALVVSWEPTPEHRAALTARYEVREPNLIDLTIGIRSEWPYPAYELFLSSYFDTALRPHVYVAGNRYDTPPDKPRWIAPAASDVFVGTGLVFPRDQHAARRSVDGRWDRLPALYQWNPQRYYERPLLMQASVAQGIAAVLMSRPPDCFSIATGYHSENAEDPFTGQNPLYLSLFGDDLRPGDERTARVRLAVTSLDASLSQPLRAYEAFMAEQG